MDEILQLREYIESQRYDEALLLLEEMEEMSKEDKLSKIRSFSIILLIHLIKQHAEQRSTKSWDFSVRNALREIVYVNKRKKSGGYYCASDDEWRAILEDAFDVALDFAAREAFEGRFEPEELLSMVDKTAIVSQARTMIWQYQVERENKV
jgi:hypothetical protein